MGSEDKSWIFDSLMCFLNGPVWNAPLQSFIEEKSLIFEPGVEDSGDYKNIYEEFKNLVDFMLCNFMEDIGITPEEFEEACQSGNKRGLPIAFEQSLFEQIRAANDYEAFKRMMTHRNVELQLQALELIQRKYGIMPESFVPKKKVEEMQSTSKQVHKSPSIEKEIMEDVVKQFPTDEIPEDEKQYILEEKEILERARKLLEIPEPPPKQEPKQKPTPKTSKSSQQPTNKTNEIDAIDLKKRQEYLRAQRDKLVALKKEARKKHLNDESESVEQKKIRPKSARAAESVLKGAPLEMPQQETQIRKSLVERLKNELVDKKE